MSLFHKSLCLFLLTVAFQCMAGKKTEGKNKRRSKRIELLQLVAAGKISQSSDPGYLNMLLQAASPGRVSLRRDASKDDKASNSNLKALKK